MGVAIIVPGISFADANLGKVNISGDVPVQALIIKGDSSYTGINAQLSVSYLPISTTQRNVEWSIVSGNEYASINSSGLLTIKRGTNAGRVNVKVVNTDNPNVYANKEIVVTYYNSDEDYHPEYGEQTCGSTAEYSMKGGKASDLGVLSENISIYPYAESLAKANCLLKSIRLDLGQARNVILKIGSVDQSGYFIERESIQITLNGGKNETDLSAQGIYLKRGEIIAITSVGGAGIGYAYYDTTSDSSKWTISKWNDGEAIAQRTDTAVMTLYYKLKYDY